MAGINRKNRSRLKYTDAESAHCPVAHCDLIPILVFGELRDTSDEESSSVQDEGELVFDDDVLNPFSKKELNNIVSDLELSKTSAELLTSRLKGNPSSLTVLVPPSTTIGIKNVSVSPLKRTTWHTVRILLSFCTSLECYSMKPMIGDY